MGSDLAGSRCTCGRLDVDLVLPRGAAALVSKEMRITKTSTAAAHFPGSCCTRTPMRSGITVCCLIIFKQISRRAGERTRRAEMKCYSRYGCRRACVKRSAPEEFLGRVRKRKRTRRKEKICNNDCARPECCYGKGAKTG